MPGPRRLRGWLAAIVAFAAIGGGIARAQSQESESQLEMFLNLNTGGGLNSGDLTNLGNGPVTGGSAIMQMITVSAGTTLTFNYDFLTNAPPLGLLSSLDPFAFITAPSLSTLADNGYNFSSPTMPAPGTGYAYQTGYQTYSYTFASGGTFTLGLGVVNVTTDQYSSALLLDDFTLSTGGLTNGTFGTGDFSGWSTIGMTSIATSAFGVSPISGDPYQALLQTASVPEPSSIIMLVLGVLGVGGACVRRKLSSSKGV